MTLVRRLARPLLASTFVAGGIHALRNAEHLREAAKPVTSKVRPAVASATASLPVNPDDKMLVQANAAIQVAAGAMLATGKFSRPASLVLAASLVPTTLAGHRFWEETEPQAKADQRVHFMKNVSMLGGLILAAVDTEGKPSAAWRVRHGAERAAKVARKRAGDLNPS